MEPTHTIQLGDGRVLDICTEEDDRGWAAFPDDASDLRCHGADADAAVAAFEADGLPTYLSLKADAGEEPGRTPEGDEA